MYYFVVYSYLKMKIQLIIYNGDHERISTNFGSVLPFRKV